MKKKISILIFVFLLLMLVRFMGITYGFFSTLISGNLFDKSIEVSTKYLAVSYTDGTAKMNFQGDYFFPGDSAEKTFSVKNTGNDLATYNIVIDNVQNEFYRIQDLRYTLYINDELVSDGALNNNAIQYLYSNREIQVGDVDNVKFVFEYSETTEVQNIDMNKSLSFYVNVNNDRVASVEENSNNSVTFLSNSDYLNNYRIYGNSIQDTATKGDPTPDNPVEIESVGDKSLNLFDPSYITSTVYSVFENKISVSKYATGSGILPSEFLEMTGLQPGDTITTYRKYQNEKGKEGAGGKVVFIKNPNGTAAGDYTVVPYLGGDVTVSTIPEDFTDANYYGLYFYSPSKADENGEILGVYTDFQIFKGEHTIEDFKSFQPYGKYIIPVTVSGKNLLKKSIMYTLERNVAGINWIYDEDSKTYIANGTQTAQLLSYALYSSVNNAIISETLKDGHKYMLTGEQKSDIEGLRFYVFATHKSGSKTTYVSSDMNSNTFTYSLGDTLTFDLRIYSSDGVMREINDVKFQPMLIDITGLSDDQILNLKKEFEEYVEPITTNIALDEPLRKIGDYVDHIDFKKQEVVRQTGAYEFNGTETISIPTSLVDGYTPFRYTKFAVIAKQPFVSNYFEYLNKTYSSATREGLGNYSTGGQMFFIISNERIPLDDIKAFKSWLTDLYNSGNPLAVYYGLAKSEEIPIKLPTILTNKGTNIIEINTSIVPSTVNIETVK